jgi:hypothetical protein
LIVIYGIVFFITGYIIYSVPWYSREEWFDKIREQEILAYKIEREKELIECTKLMKPLLEKSMPVNLQNNKILGPLFDKMLVKNKSLKLRFVQENFSLYDHESAGYCIIADSVLIELNGKLSKNKPFDLELCAFDKNNNPVFYNTILKCMSNDEIERMIKEGKGKYYCTFKSDVLPFESAKTREMAFMDIAVFEKAESFNLVSRYK